MHTLQSVHTADDDVRGASLCPHRHKSPLPTSDSVKQLLQKSFRRTLFQPEPTITVSRILLDLIRRPPPPHNFIRRPLNVLLDPPDKLTVEVERLININKDMLEIITRRRHLMPIGRDRQSPQSSNLLGLQTTANQHVASGVFWSVKVGHTPRTRVRRRSLVRVPRLTGKFEEEGMPPTAEIEACLVQRRRRFIQNPFPWKSIRPPH
ncbi:hypothetical protein EVAR_98162_1 [Eumeta japonica]|uniref:Uncharacterized protein n=1 Tax=Eumeta variegata TaxID=151549 RepID=A0A4C1YK52_EUMVA|nr:hypothetical protein EVAR_98162_1 [Eumeta japonica]